MDIKTAIQKAIEGGWEAHLKTDPLRDSAIEKMLENLKYERQPFLNPSFWQSLGKAMGWNEEVSWVGKKVKLDWLYHWHRFIDHLAEGKSIEDFFKELK